MLVWVIKPRRWSLGNHIAEPSGQHSGWINTLISVDTSGSFVSPSEFVALEAGAMHSTLASYWGKQDSKRRCCRLFGDWKLVPRICKNTLGTGTQNTMMANIALLVDM